MNCYHFCKWLVTTFQLLVLFNGVTHFKDLLESLSRGFYNPVLQPNSALLYTKDFSVVLVYLSLIDILMLLDAKRIFCLLLVRFIQHTISVLLLPYPVIFLLEYVNFFASFKQNYPFRLIFMWLFSFFDKITIYFQLTTLFNVFIS